MKVIRVRQRKTKMTRKKDDRNQALNRFDAVSAYMRKMDRYGLSDF